MFFKCLVSTWFWSVWFPSLSFVFLWSWSVSHLRTTSYISLSICKVICNYLFNKIRIQLFDFFRPKMNKHWYQISWIMLLAILADSNSFQSLVINFNKIILLFIFQENTHLDMNPTLDLPQLFLIIFLPKHLYSLSFSDSNIFWGKQWFSKHFLLKSEYKVQNGIDRCVGRVNLLYQLLFDLTRLFSSSISHSTFPNFNRFLFCLLILFQYSFLELPVMLGFGPATGPTLKTALCHICTLVGRRINTAHTSTKVTHSMRNSTTFHPDL